MRSTAANGGESWGAILPRSITLQVLDPNGSAVDFLSVSRKLGPQNGAFSATLESALPSNLAVGSYTLMSTLKVGDSEDRRALRFQVAP